MDDGGELDALRRDVRWLKDRAEVLDVVATHARGCDRHDVELLSGTYHDDGVDVHGDDGQRRARLRRLGQRRARRHLGEPPPQHHHPPLRDRRRRGACRELRAW